MDCQTKTSSLHKFPKHQAPECAGGHFIETLNPSCKQSQAPSCHRGRVNVRGMWSGTIGMFKSMASVWAETLPFVASGSCASGTAWAKLAGADVLSEDLPVLEHGLDFWDTRCLPGLPRVRWNAARLSITSGVVQLLLKDFGKPDGRWRIGFVFQHGLTHTLIKSFTCCCVCGKKHWLENG